VAAKKKGRRGNQVIYYWQNLYKPRRPFLLSRDVVIPSEARNLPASRAALFCYLVMSSFRAERGISQQAAPPFFVIS
jgi:hypothetical protein